MTEKKESETGSTDDKPKRTTATLDLTAQEIKSEDAQTGPSERQDKPKDNQSERSETDTTSSTTYADQPEQNGDKTNKSGFFQKAIETTQSTPFIQYIIAGVIGGLIVLLLNAVTASDPAQNQNTLAATEQTTNQLAQRLAELEKTITQLANTTSSNDTADITARLAQLETNVQQTLNEQIERFEVQMRTQVSEQIQQAQTRQEKSSDYITSSQDLGQFQDTANQITSTLEQTKSQITFLQDKLEDIDQQNSEQDRRLIGLANNITSITQTGRSQNITSSSNATLETRLENLEQQMSRLSQINLSRQQSTQQTAFMIALANLKRTIDQGKRFDTELEAVKRIAPTTLALDPLKRHSESNIPAFEKLKSQFPDLLRETLKVSKTSEGEGFWHRLTNSAASLISIRRTGNILGTSTEAVLARMEVHLKNDNFQEALNESKALTGQAQKTLQPWSNQLKARLDIEQALQDIETELLAKLGGSTQKQAEDNFSAQPSQ